MNKYNKIVFVNGSAPPLNADNLNHMDEGIERATDGAIALESEIATARGDSADLNTRFTADEASLEAVKSEIATARGDSADLNTRFTADEASLEAVKSEIATARGGQNSLGARLDKTDKSIARKLDSMPFDSEPKNNSPCYLTSGAVYNALLVKADKTALATKYDSSNIESGTSTLTPYSTQIDKIKSATCLYEKIGDIVIVNVTVIMNATSLGGTSTIALLNMPFSNKSDVIVHDIGISKNGGMFRGSVNKSAWLQFTPLNKQAYNFVADEQVNFSLIYKI